jgi:hypothetical protein
MRSRAVVETMIGHFRALAALASPAIIATPGNITRSSLASAGILIGTPLSAALARPRRRRALPDPVRPARKK